MGKALRFIVVLLAVTAVATILITPSTADDAVGVTHRVHSALAFTVPVNLLSPPLQISPPQVLDSLTSHPLLPSDLLDLVCQRLC